MLENAYPPIEVTELGIVTDISALQAKNAESPILVTELPIVTDVSAVQPWNALSGIVFTLFPIVRLVRLKQLSKTGYYEAPIVVQFSALKITEVRLGQL